MKVTVCFQDLRVVVPCLLSRPYVKHLTHDALIRYNRLIAKPIDEIKLSRMNVKLVLNDGGILDPDDLIIDVVDDKEQMTAIFDAKDEHDRTALQPYQGDGMSDSSYPDDVTTDVSTLLTAKNNKSSLNVNTKMSSAKSSTQSKIKDTAEPNIKILSNEANNNSTNSPRDSNYEVVVTKKDFNKKLKLHVRRSSETDIQQNFTNFPSVTRTESMNIKENRSDNMSPQKKHKIFLIKLAQSSEPLGINVTQNVDVNNVNNGLLIHSIEKNSRIDRDGRLKNLDCILSINGVDLEDRDFAESQNIFRSAMKEKELLLKISRQLEEDQLSDYQENNDERNMKDWERLEIILKKSAKGLGFTVTTYERVPGIEINPTYVKEIIPDSPVFLDGRLKKGDIIEKVNDFPIENHTDMISIYNSVNVNEFVKLTVLRLNCSPEFLKTPEIDYNNISRQNLNLSSDVQIKTYSQNSLPPSQVSSSPTSLDYNLNQNSNRLSEQQVRSMVDLREINQINESTNDDETQFRRYVSDVDLSSLNVQKMSDIMYAPTKNTNTDISKIPNRHKVSRNKDLNESFRSAMDKSVDTQKITLKDSKEKSTKKHTRKKLGWLFGRNKKLVEKRDQACQVFQTEMSPTKKTLSPISMTSFEKSPTIISFKPQSIPPPPLASTIYTQPKEPLYSIVKKTNEDFNKYSDSAVDASFNNNALTFKSDSNNKSILMNRKSLHLDIPKDHLLRTNSTDLRTNAYISNFGNKLNEPKINIISPPPNFYGNINNHSYDENQKSVDSRVSTSSISNIALVKHNLKSYSDDLNLPEKDFDDSIKNQNNNRFLKSFDEKPFRTSNNMPKSAFIPVYKENYPHDMVLPQLHSLNQKYYKSHSGYKEKNILPAYVNTHQNILDKQIIQSNKLVFNASSQQNLVQQEYLQPLYSNILRHENYKLQPLSNELRYSYQPPDIIQHSYINSKSSNQFYMDEKSNYQDESIKYPDHIHNRAFFQNNMHNKNGVIYDEPRMLQQYNEDSQVNHALNESTFLQNLKTYHPNFENSNHKLNTNNMLQSNYYINNHLHANDMLLNSINYQQKDYLVPQINDISRQSSSSDAVFTHDHIRIPYQPYVGPHNANKSLDNRIVVPEIVDLRDHQDKYMNSSFQEKIYSNNSVVSSPNILSRLMQEVQLMESENRTKKFRSPQTISSGVTIFPTKN